MLHSTVTSKGQTTIPEKIRKALRIKPGDKLEYEVEGDRATIRVHPGGRSLKVHSPATRGRGCLLPKSARPQLRLRVMRTPGEQAKTCGHESDCPLSRTGS